MALESPARHGRYPQATHWALGTSLLHHPSLNQFTLLPGVTTVHDALGFLHQSFDNRKLLLDTLVVYEFDSKAVGNHG